MPHGTTNRPVIDRVTKARLAKIQSVEMNGMHKIENLGMFIDTHRDQPHVGGFYDDIHRGACRPTAVDYLIEDDSMVNRESGQVLHRHDKHLFVTPEYFGQFLIDFIMNNGGDPRDGSGCLPTSHFRDARARVYELKSFREMVRIRAAGEGVK